MYLQEHNKILIDKFNKLLHNKDIDKASKIIALNPTFNDKQLMRQR